MLNNLQQVSSSDYTNNYFIGQVVDNDDPSHLERVKVSIPNLYESADTSLLPWVGPAVHRTIPKGDGFGSFSVPPIGSFLIVILQDGDPQYPLYIGTAYINGYQMTVAETNYPSRYGLKDRSGNIFYVDTASGTARFEHHSGTYLTVANNGNVTIVVSGDIVSSADTWTHTGAVNIDGSLTVTGTIDADGNITSAASVLANDRGTTIGLSKHVHEGVRGGDDRTQQPALVAPGDLP